MIPAYCPRCGKPLLPDARQCPFCGLETFVPGPPETPPGAQGQPPGSWPPAEGQVQPPVGWGAPQPDQTSQKTTLIVGCLILFVLVLVILPIAIFMLTAPRFIEGIQEFGTFPPDFPFPSFFP